MAKISVTYEVPLSVMLDTETGEVESVCLHADCFQDGVSDPEVYAGYDEDETLPEYLPVDHPVAIRALEISGNVRLGAPEMLFPFAVDRDKGGAEDIPTFGLLGRDDLAQRFIQNAEQVMDASAKAEHQQRQRVGTEREERRIESRASTQITPGTPSRPSPLAAEKS
jgi:hypothetical protein